MVKLMEMRFAFVITAWRLPPWLIPARFVLVATTSDNGYHFIYGDCFSVFVYDHRVTL